MKIFREHLEIIRSWEFPSQEILLKKIFWNIKMTFSFPFIYGMIFPAIFLHFCLEIYHQVCFRIYKIERVDPKKYFKTERDLLPYLKWHEKINCFYCSYFNGLVSYTKEIAGRTEKFFCPIKHQEEREGTHQYYKNFLEYGDKQGFENHKKEKRKKCFTL